MTILVINNYFKKKDLSKVVKISDVLKKVGKDSVILDYSDFDREGEMDGFEALILSGSSASLLDFCDFVRFRSEIKFVRMAEVPVLGICFGHQLIGVSFGSSLYSLDGYVRGFSAVEILVDDVIFSPWKSGEELFVMQNHIDCVERVPPGFVCLAKSKKCSVEVMRHVKRPIYGVQAHVERFSEEHAEGFEIIRNFVERVVLGV